MLGVCGCAPEPDVVFVDLSAVELRASPRTDSSGTFDADPYSVVKAVPDLDGVNVFFGSAEERATETLDLYRETQRQAAEAVLERLKTAYIEEARNRAEADRAVAHREHEERLSSEIDALYGLFVAHAAEIEPLRFELAGIVGFPDPDPRSLKVPAESNQKAYKRFLAARTIRERVIALDKEYKAEVERRMEGIQLRRNALLDSIDSKETAGREEARNRARSEADKVTRDTLDALESSALETEARLPPVTGASSSVNSDPVSVGQAGTAPAKSESRDDLEAQLAVFLKTSGYRLTDSPKGGRDVTQEFLAWRRNYLAGR